MAPEPSEPADTAPVLRRGDQGPQVVELQQRLRQVWLYQGDADGRYSHRVEDAVRRHQWHGGINGELGVYRPRTRPSGPRNCTDPPKIAVSARVHCARVIA